MITGVILARNEEDNIVACLEALRPHVTEILLIDMESSDRTVELALPYVRQVLPHPLMEDFDGARNVAFPFAANEWLWFVDADERIPALTGQLINDVLRNRGNELVAITIPFKSQFCGKWMQHCGWWPGYTMPRVLKRGFCRFADRVHGGVHLQGSHLILPADPAIGVDHLGYRDISHYLEKSNRYTSSEARWLASEDIELSWEPGIRDMMRDLWLCYEQNQGQQDGLHGWNLSWLSGQYRWIARAKLMDVARRKGMSEIRASIPPNLDAVIELMQRELAALRGHQPTLPLGLVWRCALSNANGPAEDAKCLVRALAKAERDLAVTNLSTDERVDMGSATEPLLKALLNVRLPGQYAAITTSTPGLHGPLSSAAINVLRTEFETDRIPSHWMPHLDLFDEIWVPSSFNLRTFRRGGAAPEKLRILPSFVDINQFSPEGLQRPRAEVHENRFVFLSVFEWQRGKGWDVLLRAYCEEFSPEEQVGLLLKLAHPNQPLEAIHEQIDAVLSLVSQSLALRPDIVLDDAIFDESQMAALFRSSNAFVLPSRGEGAGRIFLKAMASGLPTIGTSGSGNSDFMDEANSMLVATTKVTVPPDWNSEVPDYLGHFWHEPDRAELRGAMRKLYRDQRFAKELGRRATTCVRAKFSMEQAPAAIEQLMRQVEGRFIDVAVPDLRPSQVSVELEGEFFAGHSFSKVNEQVATELARNDELALSLRRMRSLQSRKDQAPCEYSLRPYFNRGNVNPPQVTIRHSFPPNFSRPSTGKWVHIQPWEYGALPLSWLPPLRDEVDEIWVPSNYVKRVYERSGVSPQKIQVIPWGVDPDTYHPAVPPLALPCEGKFVFLFVGGTIHRKGIDTLLEAYKAEFGPQEPVCLVIKDHGTDSFYRHDHHRQLIQGLASRSDTPEIIYLERFMTEGQLASLYTAADCLVSPYRGEGFGMPILEGMACGVPAIVPVGGASDDFVSKHNGFLVPSREVECEHSWRLCGPATELRINVEDVRAALRTAYSDPSHTHRLGARAADDVHRHYSWARTAQVMAERITTLTDHRNVAPTTADSSPSPSGTTGRPTTLSLCLVVRNAERELPECLSRVRPFVDEVIVVDLESVDRTREVVLEYGARLYQKPQSSSRVAAKNYAIGRATSDWILDLEVTERLAEPDITEIIQLIRTLPGGIAGVRVNVSSTGTDGTAHAAQRQLRLFRNHNDITFDSSGDGQVEASIRGLQAAIIDSSAVILAAACSNGTNLGSDRAASDACVDRHGEVTFAGSGVMPDHNSVRSGIVSNAATLVPCDKGIELFTDVDRVDPTSLSDREEFPQSNKIQLEGSTAPYQAPVSGELLLQAGVWIRRHYYAGDEGVRRTVIDADDYRLKDVAWQPDGVVDLGGHIGCFSWFARKRWAAKTVGIEAVAENAEMYRKNCPDCVLIEGACTYEAPPLKIRMSLHPSMLETGSSTIFAPSHSKLATELYTDEYRSVVPVTLDQIIDEHFPDAKHLLVKMDIEGSELSVLENVSDRALGRIRSIRGEWHDRRKFMDLVRRRFLRHWTFRIFKDVPEHDLGLFSLDIK